MEEQEGGGRRASCAIAGITCPVAGVERHRAIVETTDSTDSAARQSRPEGGQGRAKGGVTSQTPSCPWDFVMHPHPGRCRRPCFLMNVGFGEAEAAHSAAERLKQSLCNGRGGRKRQMK